MYIPVGVLIDSLAKEINLRINVFFVRLSTMTMHGARRAWNWEDVDSCRFLSRDLLTITVYGAGRGRRHVTAGLCFVGCG